MTIISCFRLWFTKSSTDHLCQVYFKVFW